MSAASKIIIGPPLEDSDPFEAATDPEPSQDECDQLGEDSEALSDLSINIEQEDYAGRPKSKGISGWVQLIRPMIHGRFMWTLSIANLIFFILMFILVIYVLVFTALMVISTDTKNGLAGKIDSVDYCSVIWSPLSDCSAKCKEVDNSYIDNPVRTSVIDDLIGICPEYLMVGYNRTVPCNVWACE